MGYFADNAIPRPRFTTTSRVMAANARNLAGMGLPSGQTGISQTTATESPPEKEPSK